ncbi:MAG: WecB/TagA/CpsF family glycosyltransferase [Ilumatobacter sp.]|uniref:WecB/TagA/CpsF family glycosyltransferase n=1 Tax=Ilumatobacter sp. TaxID=1967498 RepID=UPI003C77AEE9
MSSVVLGVPIEDLTLESTSGLIDALIRDGRASGRTHQIATVNVDFVVNALHDPELMDILRNTSVNIADGMPLLWASTAMGTPLTERVAGSELFAGLGRESQTRGWDVHVFGGAPDVAERTRAMIADQFPNARFTVDSGPKLSDISSVPDEVIEGLAERDADLLCVALGNPKQEYFIHRYGARIGCPVMIGVGGSMDMLVGDRKRASARVQNAGLEWIVRALQEPGRLGPRYVRDGVVFAPKIVREQFAGRKQRWGWTFEVTPGSSSTRAVPVLRTREDAGEQLDAVPPTMLDPHAPVVIQLAGVDELSWQGVAILCLLVRHARRHDLDMTTYDLSGALRASLADHAIGEWLVDILEQPRTRSERTTHDDSSENDGMNETPIERNDMSTPKTQRDSVATDNLDGT